MDTDDPNIVLFDLFCDEVVREILRMLGDEALTASQLAERCEVSEPTIYRKVDSMKSHDLLETGTIPDSEGTHVTVYKSKVDRVEIALDPGAERYSVDVVRRQSIDRFKHLWEGLRDK